MKEWLYYKRKSILSALRKLGRSTRRIFMNDFLSEKDSYTVPIIINNYNRLTYLKTLIEWLEKNGYTNIIILDNNSTYPPLLDYYKTTKHKIVYLKDNLGYMALWKSVFFKEVKNSYYVYTDPDVVPNNDCPKDLVFQLYKVLKANTQIEKAGAALKLDDLPEYYNLKNEVIKAEEKYWTKKVSDNVFDALVDTTFALYRPLASGNAEECKAYRLGGKYCLHHLPWYENSSQLNEENQFYKNSIVKNTTVWSQQ